MPSRFAGSKRPGESGRPRVDPGAILLLTPILWGATFPGTKIALRHLPILSFMAWSRTLGVLTILVLLPLIRRGERATGRAWGPRGPPPWSRVLLPGTLLGGLMLLGYVLQTEGLARTTATNAGFITCLYVVFTPVLGAVALRQRAPRAAWLAVAISFAGLTLLSVRAPGQIRLHTGDLLVLSGSVAWAAHIVAVGRYSPRFPVWMLSLAQMAAAAGFQLLLAAGTGLRFHQAASGTVWPLLVLTGVLGSGVAFTIQIMGQRTLTPARAVILLAGESLFSALFAALWIGERLAAHQWAGAALVVAAMAYSELSARRPPSMLVEPATAE